MKRQARHAAREISYAHGAQTRGGKMMIRAMENASGRIGLIKRADGYEKEVAAGRDFWVVMAERYGLTLDVIGGSINNIPSTGPVVVISNHPYGIMDGLMMGYILSKRRKGDFKILAHNVFTKAEDINRVVLPISFEASKEAIKTNLATRKEAMRYLNEGGAIGIFPGGTVSTSAKLFSHPLDPFWRAFTARLITKTGAKVVPVFFDGHTSRMFQLASHMHNTLRKGLLIKEFKRRVDTKVGVVIGSPIAPEKLDALKSDSKGLMDFLRKSTYDLSPKPLKTLEYGYENEE